MITLNIKKQEQHSHHLIKEKIEYFFEKSSRKYNDKEIVEFLVSNFVATDNTSVAYGLEKLSILAKEHTKNG
jgi:hypothetical protein